MVKTGDLVILKEMSDMIRVPYYFSPKMKMFLGGTFILTIDEFDEVLTLVDIETGCDTGYAWQRDVIKYISRRNNHD